jgi:hypothetical protein
MVIPQEVMALHGKMVFIVLVAAVVVIEAMMLVSVEVVKEPQV